MHPKKMRRILKETRFRKFDTFCSLDSHGSGGVWFPGIWRRIRGPATVRTSKCVTQVRSSEACARAGAGRARAKFITEWRISTICLKFKLSTLQVLPSARASSLRSRRPTRVATWLLAGIPSQGSYGYRLTIITGQYNYFTLFQFLWI